MRMSRTPCVVPFERANFWKLKQRNRLKRASRKSLLFNFTCEKSPQRNKDICLIIAGSSSLQLLLHIFSSLICLWVTKLPFLWYQYLRSASFSYNWIKAFATIRQDSVKLKVLLDCCYLCADLVTAVTTAAACQGLSPRIPSPNYRVYWKLKIYQLMKRGKHYRQCDVINSCLAFFSHVRQRQKRGATYYHKYESLSAGKHSKEEK